MKSTLRYVSLFCILITIPLAVTWATWEGNAGTGMTSDFPGSGLYARSNMFPRNTLVKIVNLETGSSVRAVITGSSDIPGLVAVLSPETAAALNIREGAVVRVRITTPAPVGEQPATGMQETEDTINVDDPDMNPEAMVPLAAIADAAEAPMVPVPETDESETDESETDESETDEPETFDEARESFGRVDEDVPVETGDSDPARTESETRSEESVEITSDDPDADDPDADDPVAEDVDDTVADDTVAEDGDEPGDIMDDAAVAALEETDSVMASEEAPVPETADQKLFYEEPELVAAEDDAGETAEEITLEPAEPRPPAADTTTFPVVPPVVTPDLPETDRDMAAEETVPYVDPVEEAPVDENPAEDKPVFAAISVLDENPAERVPPADSITETSGTDFPWIDRLESGAYYVQVAAYRDFVNIRSILNRFGKKYPVVVQKGDSSAKPLVKVYIGPLKKDEYGAVLEYFRKNGFEDAFMKQLP